MNEKPLPTPEFVIERPELWTLLMAVGDDSLQYILFSRAQENSLHYGHVPLPHGHDYLHTLENAVYDHPLLLDDYHEVKIVTASPHFLILPPDTAAQDDDTRRLLEAAFPDDNGDMCCCKLPQSQVDMAFFLPRGVLGFLNRTFNLAPVLHHLYPLCEHFFGLNEGSNIKRMFVDVHEHNLDMVVYDRGRLFMANTFPFRNGDDAAFLVLHAWQECQLDTASDELQLAGTKAMRETLAPRLREYIRYVMPAIFPAAALTIGHDALSAPLDLILLATCE